MKPTLPAAVADLVVVNEFASSDFTASSHNCLSISCAFPEVQTGQNHRTTAPQARIKPKAAPMRSVNKRSPSKLTVPNLNTKFDIAAIRIACQPVEGSVPPLSTKRADESVIASMSVSPETMATE